MSASRAGESSGGEGLRKGFAKLQPGERSLIHIDVVGVSTDDDHVRAAPGAQSPEVGATPFDLGARVLGDHRRRLHVALTSYDHPLAAPVRSVQLERFRDAAAGGYEEGDHDPVAEVGLRVPGTRGRPWSSSV